MRKYSRYLSLAYSPRPGMEWLAYFESSMKISTLPPLSRSDEEQPPASKITYITIHTALVLANENAQICNSACFVARLHHVRPPANDRRFAGEKGSNLQHAAIYPCLSRKHLGPFQPSQILPKIPHSTIRDRKEITPTSIRVRVILT